MFLPCFCVAATTKCEMRLANSSKILYLQSIFIDIIETGPFSPFPISFLSYIHRHLPLLYVSSLLSVACRRFRASGRLYSWETFCSGAFVHFCSSVAFLPPNCACFRSFICSYVDLHPFKVCTLTHWTEFGFFLLM